MLADTTSVVDDEEESIARQLIPALLVGEFGVATQAAGAAGMRSEQ